MAEKVIKIRYDVDTIDVEKANQLLRRISDTTDQLTKETQQYTSASTEGIRATKRSADELEREYNQLKHVTKNTFDIRQLKAYQSQMEKIEKEADEMGVKLTQAGKKSTGTFTNLSGQVLKFGALLGGLAIASVFGNIGSNIFDVTAEFEKFNAVLTNSLGSQSEAEVAMLKIQDIAAKTPFSVSQLTDSYVRLVNAGIKPTSQEIIKLGDLAASQGKGFDQLTEAIIDAQTGEFERLKEFGIRASKEGDRVTFTFKGVQQQVDFTSESITNYIKGLGDLQGVSGTMAATSATLGGQVSNLGDSFDQLFLAIGQNGSGVISNLIGGFNNLVQAITDIVKGNQKLHDEALKLKIEDIIDEKTPEQLRDLLSKIESEYQKADEAYYERVRARKKLEATTINDSKGLLRGAIKLEQEAQQKRDDLFEALKRASEKYTQLQEEEAKKAESAVEKQLGLIEAQEKKVKELQETLKAAKTEGEIISIKFELRGAEAELERLKQLGEATRKLKENLEALSSVDDQGLTVYGQKLATIYKVLYGEQVKGENQVSDATKKRSDAFISSAESSMAVFRANFQEKQDKIKQEEAEEIASYERRREAAESIAHASIGFIQAVADYQNQLDQNRIARLEENQKRELALAGNNVKEQNKINLEYDKKVRDLRRKQAEREKRMAIFQAIVNVAQGITAALGMGVPGLILSLLVAAAGAVQIATISSQPIPAFNKGTRSVPGTGNKDTVPALLTPGERVITASTNKKYMPILDAIHQNKIDPELLNNIAMGRSGGSQVIVKEDKELVEFLKNKPEHQTILTEEGLEHYYKRGSSRTKYIGGKYRSK